MPKTLTDWYAVKRDVDQAPHGQKTAVVEQTADRLGCSTDTVYRRLRALEPESQRPGSGRRPSIPDELIEAVADLRARSRLLGLGERTLSYEQCIQILVDEDHPGAREHLVTDSGRLATSSVSRRMRQAGYGKAQPYRLIEASFAGEEHQLDWSRSKYFQVDPKLSRDGQFMLRVSGRELHYKESGGRLRSWLITVKDSYSRLRLTRMVTVAGESALVAISFLDWCWRRDPDAHPMRHAPHALKLDNGSTARRREFKQMCAALDIDLKTSTPYNSQSQGKVESSWRSLWQRFELPLATRLGDGGVISLAEYNARLHDHLTTVDADLKHPVLRGSRRAEYERSLIAYPPREVSADALQLACYAEERKVSRARVVQLGGHRWLAPDDVVDERIVIHQNAHGEMIAECLDRPRKPFALTPFLPNQLGDFTGPVDVPATKALKRAADQIRVPRAAPVPALPAPNVVRMAPAPETVTPSGPFSEPSGSPDVLTEAEARAFVNRALKPRRLTWDALDSVFTPMLDGGVTADELTAVLHGILNPGRQAV